MSADLALPLLAVGAGSGAVYFFTREILKRASPHLSNRVAVLKKDGQTVLRYLHNETKLADLLVQARFKAEWPARKFLWLRVGGVLLVLWWMFAYGNWLVGLMFLIFTWCWPELYLRRLITIRQKQLRQGLTYVIDLLRMQVNAGLNLETSFRGLARQSSGVWEPELCQLMRGIDHGLPLTQALTKLAERLQIDDVQRLAAALKQAQVLGVSLAETLTIQAETLRTRRRQRAEEQARLASVKIALPLVFLIFPALLIIYIAPAVLRIMQLS